jgi:hypothetical protein
MFSKSSWLHLRIPFSYFLLPVFLFSLSISPNLNQDRMLWVFIIVHFLLYPASNGYNSYFDKDEGSIGGLKNPPPVNKGLYWLSLTLDALALIIGFVKINALFAVMLLIYGLVSKAYSHPLIRLKRMAYMGWLMAGLFQGLFTFMMCYVGINKFGLTNLWRPEVLVPGMLTSIMLWANYPMTQVYQHEEDQRRGDITLSVRLGIMGTFYFVALVFALAFAGFIYYFNHFFELRYAVYFIIASLPILTFFLYWFLRVRKDVSLADYRNTMRLNFISATCLNIFFVYFFLDSTQVLQAVMGGY